MDVRELAEKMLQWGELKQKLDLLEAEISTEVLRREKTQTVGDVRASYSKGRRSYNYEAACKGRDLKDSDLEPYVIRCIDWRRVATEHLNLSKDELPFTASAPRVTLKLVKK